MVLRVGLCGVRLTQKIGLALALDELQNRLGLLEGGPGGLPPFLLFGDDFGLLDALHLVQRHLDAFHRAKRPSDDLCRLHGR